MLIVDATKTLIINVNEAKINSIYECLDIDTTKPFNNGLNELIDEAKEKCINGQIEKIILAGFKTRENEISSSINESMKNFVEYLKNKDIQVYKN